MDVIVRGASVVTADGERTAGIGMLDGAIVDQHVHLNDRPRGVGGGRHGHA